MQSAPRRRHRGVGVLIGLALLTSACAATTENHRMAAGAGGEDGTFAGGEGEDGFGGTGPGTEGGTSTVDGTGGLGGGSGSGSSGTGSGTAGSSGGTGGSSSGPGTSTPGSGGGGGDPIRLGYVVQDNSGVSALLGSGLASNDDTQQQRREMEALVKWANDNGGVAGRRIQATGTLLSATSTTETREAACVAMTEDQKNTVIIDAQLIVFERLWSCFAKRKAVVSAIATAADNSYINSVAPYLATTWSTIDRQFAAMADGLKAAGYFEGGKLGIVLADEPTVIRAYDRVLAPRLAGHGVTPAEVRRITTNATNGQQQQQSSSAVLDFQRSGVNRVIFVHNVLVYSTFTQQAETQTFRPRYGFGDYQAIAGSAALLGDADQNKDAMAISSVRGVPAVADDASRASTDSSSPFTPATLTAGTRRCYDLHSKLSGRDYYKPASSGASALVLTHCDHFFLWLDAARQLGADYTPGRFGAGLRQLGAYPSAIHNDQNFSSGRQDGAATYRVGRFTDRCQCFVAVTGFLPYPQ